MMENMTYTQAVQRLEEIMEAIQGGRMDVDSLAVALREATELVAFCRSRLFKVDDEVKKLLENMPE